MSDTETMARIMRHAARSLTAAVEAIREINNPSSSELVRYTQAIAAMALARGVLEMVAASVEPEHTATARRLVDGYEAWAEANNEMGMTGTELGAVARFLREAS